MSLGPAELVVIFLIFVLIMVPLALVVYLVVYFRRRLDQVDSRLNELERSSQS